MSAGGLVPGSNGRDEFGIHVYVRGRVLLLALLGLASLLVLLFKLSGS